MNGTVDRWYRKKVAIVGGGSSGIAALWALNGTYHDVYLYEAADRLGGHTNTVNWKVGKFSAAVDTGFIVMNNDTYPNFVNFLKRLHIDTEPTKVSLGFSRDHGAFEWATANLATLFSQRRNIFSPKMWRMLFDIARFNHFAVELLADDENEHRNGSTNGSTSHAEHMESIGQYLDRNGYSKSFKDEYLLPMVAAASWTNPDKTTLDFPAKTLVRYLWSQNLITTTSTQPNWLALSQGSHAYVKAVMKGFPSNHLFLKTAVRHISPEPSGRVVVYLENGKSDVFDHVIIATQADQAMSILKASGTSQELSILSKFQTSQTEAVLHSDLSLMPKRQKAWSSLNYITQTTRSARKADVDRVSLTYNMNALQHIPRETFGDVLVTLNPLYRPRPEKTQGRYFYSRPLYTPAAVEAQELLPKIQNKRGISYAGSWTMFGSHENGFSSGLFVAKEHLGAKLPFEFKDPSRSRFEKPKLTLLDHARSTDTAELRRGPLVAMGVLLLSPSAAGTLAVSIPPNLAASEPPEIHLDVDASEAAGPVAEAACYERSDGAGARKIQGAQHDNAAQLSDRYYALSLSMLAGALGYASVPLYKMICQTVGWGGQPIRVHGGIGGDGDISSRVIPVTDANRIRVTFSSSVSDTLPWKFTPQQREVRVLPGETALAFYTATNRGDKDIIGVATYSVTPPQCAPYFSKIQCFCFEEQRLNAGETVDMPVFFYLDPDLLNDINMRGVETVTLNYTFFKAKYDNNGRFQSPAAA
ncbi:Cytochrome c oxidase assembly protein COX11 [Paramyrothecium foliicola]|nr:Cytochrome c oxidase assembly protein COX11 [Paramyrothecium foliicola]